MPGRRRGGRRLNIVDENGNRLDELGREPVNRENQANVPLNNNGPQVQPAQDIQGPR